MDIHKKIKNFLLKLSSSNFIIAIFGDSVLDEYYNVINNRVSPEFPIPVSLTETETPFKTEPGGAGNVYKQFSNYSNIELEFYSVLDYHAEEQYSKCGVDTKKCLIIDGNNTIPRKRRFYNGSFPLFRWDVEKNNFGINNIKQYQNRLYSKLNKSRADVCIFSDYAKGVFSRDINYKFRFSIVDPKKDPINIWKNCDIFKPNKNEAFNLSGENNPIKQCLYFKKELNCKNVLITNSYKGFYGIDKNNNFFEYKSENLESSSNVIGGGDCFISHLAICNILNFDIYDSAEIAFNASYYYLTKNSNNFLSQLDFYKMLNCKYVDKNALKNRKFEIVFTNGCFDAGLTPGHIECLKFAKKLGKKVVVALNSDKSIKRIKGKNRPLFSLEDRIDIISSIEYVDFVVSFDEDTPENLIKYIRPDYIVKGGDYKKEDVIGKEFSKVLICPKKDCLSTTEKIKSLCLNIN